MILKGFKWKLVLILAIQRYLTASPHWLKYPNFRCSFLPYWSLLQFYPHYYTSVRWPRFTNLRNYSLWLKRVTSQHPFSQLRTFNSLGYSWFLVSPTFPNISSIWLWQVWTVSSARLLCIEWVTTSSWLSTVITPTSTRTGGSLQEWGSSLY